MKFAYGYYFVETKRCRQQIKKEKKKKKTYLSIGFIKQVNTRPFASVKQNDVWFSRINVKTHGRAVYSVKWIGIN